MKKVRDITLFCLVFIGISFIPLSCTSEKEEESFSNCNFLNESEKKKLISYAKKKSIYLQFKENAKISDNYDTWKKRIDAFSNLEIKEANLIPRKRSSSESGEGWSGNLKAGSAFKYMNLYVRGEGDSYGGRVRASVTWNYPYLSCSVSPVSSQLNFSISSIDDPIISWSNTSISATQKYFVTLLINGNTSLSEYKTLSFSFGESFSLSL